MLEIARSAQDLSGPQRVRPCFGRGNTAVDERVVRASAKGEVYGLAGESGSGKSTIARMIMGLTSADGRRDPARWRRHYRDRTGGRAPQRQVQMVFQNPGSSLNPRRTVGQSISVPLEVARARPRGSRASRIDELLDMVHLPAEFSPSAIRTNFPAARSSASPSPGRLPASRRLLVLDEPTSALDVSVQARVIDLLVDLGRGLDLTYLFISHDLSLMRNFAQDRIGVLYLGQIVETGKDRRGLRQSATRLHAPAACLRSGDFGRGRGHAPRASNG